MFADLRQFVETMMLAAAALLPIVNPLGGAPVYLAKTVDLTPDAHEELAKRVAINGFLLLLGSAFIGAYVLDFFGLSVPIVRIAGGIVVCSIAWNLLQAPDAQPSEVQEAARAITPADLRRRAFYPLTMPLTVGPGSISVAITLGASPPRGARALIVTALGHVSGMLIVAIAITSAIATPTSSCASSAMSARWSSPACPLSSCCASVWRSCGTASARCCRRCCREAPADSGTRVSALL